MSEDYRELLDTLQQLELLLRRLDWWDAEPPDPGLLHGTVPFLADRLSFQQWLQWVFIPRVHELVERGGRLDHRCEIAPAAQEMWRDNPEQAARLLPLLRRLDRLVTRHFHRAG